MDLEKIENRNLNRIKEINLEEKTRKYEIQNLKARINDLQGLPIQGEKKKYIKKIRKVINPEKISEELLAVRTLKLLRLHFPEYNWDMSHISYVRDRIKRGTKVYLLPEEMRKTGLLEKLY